MGNDRGRQRAKFFDDARGSPGHRDFVIFASFCADPLSSNGRKIFAHKIPKFSKGLRTEFSGNRTLLRRCEKWPPRLTNRAINPIRTELPLFCGDVLIFGIYLTVAGFGLIDCKHHGRENQDVVRC
jgi:hypothetical protein